MNRKERRTQEKAARKSGSFDPNKTKGTEVSNFLYAYATGSSDAPSVQPPAPGNTLEMDLEEAGRLANAGQVEDLFLHAQAMISRHDGHGDAHYMAGLAAFHLGRPDDALAHMTAALEGVCQYVDPAMYAAELYLQKDDLEAAERYTRMHLGVHPDEPGSLFRLGYLLQLKEDFTEAITVYEKAREVLPDNADLRVNLGFAYFQSERVDDAISSYETAARLDPNQGQVYLNLGLAYLQQRNMTEANKAYTKAVELMPDNIEAMFGYAKCLRANHDYAKAVDFYARVLEQDSTRVDAHWEMGSALEALGEQDRAIQAYKDCLSLAPEHETAKHLLSAIQGDTQDEAPREYVQGLFDDFADSFDDTLVNQLDYAVPAELRAAIETSAASQLADGGTIGSALDLGCGTGLVGEQIRGLVEMSHGIDLSGKMIELANAKHVYDEIWAVDINEFLEDGDRGLKAYDLVLSGDVFVYMGELDRTFAAASRRLVKGGLFIFTVEDSEVSEIFQVKPSGRFGHGDGYIGSLAGKHGFFQKSAKSLALRKDGDDTVFGRLVVLEKE